MDEPKRQAIQFLEKEIKTYSALALFLAKKGIKERVNAGRTEVIISPDYYRERMREAKRIVSELRKPNYGLASRTRVTPVPRSPERPPSQR
jgi:hypothetical protein